ncbi:hypothetical protein HYW55_01815 [Candidatus Gottesmanbacteria bacterium]|nr:hypothetical protein [Candidatus Gottesmanbacteria bacterium]
MNNKVLLAAVVILSILGIGGGLVLNARNNSVSLETSGSNEGRDIDANQVISSPTIKPSPTIPVLSKSVKSIDSTTIVITGASGDLKLPRTSPILKYFKRVGGNLVATTSDEVKVGQNVTYTLVVPGKEAHLIIEQ